MPMKTRVLLKYTGEANDYKYNNTGVYNTTCVIDANGKPVASASEIAKAIGNETTMARPYYEARALSVYSLNYAPTFNGTEVFDSSLSPKRRGHWRGAPSRERTFNNLYHLKSRLVYLPHAIFVPAYNGTLIANFKCYTRQTPNVAIAPSPDLSYVGFETYDDASRRAWWSMKPRFEGEISMLNFLFELKDFKSIAKAMIKLRSISLITERLKSLRARMNRLPRKINLATATTGAVLTSAAHLGKTTAVMAAELRLINEFAVRPLMNDWTSILGQAGEIVRDVQSDFKLRGLEPQVSHYSEQLNVQDTLKVRALNAYNYADGIYQTQVFTATHQYKYNYQMRDRSDAFMRYWGLNLTPEAIWNALPFSFLVDYFAAVGDSLHFMNADPNVTILSKQYCESILQSYSSGVTCSGDSRALTFVDGKIASKGTIITGYSGSLYQRRVCPPNKGMATPKFKLPSGKQGWNMAALATCFLGS